MCILGLVVKTHEHSGTNRKYTFMYIVGLIVNTHVHSGTSSKYTCA